MGLLWSIGESSNERSPYTKKRILSYTDLEKPISFLCAHSFNSSKKPMIFYCASDILICTPALVFVVGALDEIYGVTFR